MKSTLPRMGRRWAEVVMVGKNGERLWRYNVSTSYVFRTLRVPACFFPTNRFSFHFLATPSLTNCFEQAFEVLFPCKFPKLASWVHCIWLMSLEKLLVKSYFMSAVCEVKLTGVVMFSWGCWTLRRITSCSNGANGVTLRTAVGTSGVKLLLFKLYDVRDCLLSHLQHINYVDCSCTFSNPDFSSIMDDRQGQSLLLAFPCGHLCAECSEQS